LYHDEALAPVGATKVVATAILGIYVVQVGLYSAGLLDLVAALAGDCAVLLGLYLYARRRGLRPIHFGLRRPAPVFLAAAALVGMSAWYLNLVLVVLIRPPGDATGLQKIVEQTPLAPTWFAIALLPAVTEELVFRGIYTRALARRFVPWVAVVLSSAVFAVYHLLPAQMISTFTLGLALGYLTLRSRSVIPSILAHLLNNTIVIIVSRDEIPAVGTWMGDHAVVMIGVTAALIGTGLALARRGERRA
jgi:membrane protease YdiL (CAAX protease family)